MAAAVVAPGFMGLAGDNEATSSLIIRSSLDIRPSFFNSINETSESYARAMGVDAGGHDSSPSIHETDLATDVAADIAIDIDQLELSPPLQVASPVIATPRPSATVNSMVYVGFEATQIRIKTIMTTLEPYKTIVTMLGPERADIMLTHTCYTIHYSRGSMHDHDIFAMLAALYTNGAFAGFFSQSRPAPALTCDESLDNTDTPRMTTMTKLPPAPKYEPRRINRGSGPDTFFNRPLASYSIMYGGYHRPFGPALPHSPLHGGY
jgi:hypothetical protein